MRKLAEKVCLITGASRGLGRATAIELAHQGARVAVNYVHSEAAALDVVATIHEAGGEAIAVQANVAHRDEVATMVDTVVDTFGRLDVLVNNASEWRGRMVVKLDPSDWEHVLGVDLTGAFHCSQLVLPHLLGQGSGHIINVTSISAIIGRRGDGAYAAAKAGLIAFTRCLAKEGARSGVLANAVAPGFIASDMMQKLPEELQQAMLKRVPLRRPAQPEEVAEAIVFLASTTYITGHVLVVDGGATM
ncbi:MAG: 3-oxoacyl-ACP reductase FabG [Chloroflexi bacterium]|nr:3-oxoacyl-ACP reductase FabG [Chloroflexota bacterium]